MQTQGGAFNIFHPRHLGVIASEKRPQVQSITKRPLFVCLPFAVPEVGYSLPHLCDCTPCFFLAVQKQNMFEYDASFLQGLE